MKRVGLSAVIFCLGFAATTAVGATVSFDFRGSTLPTNNTWVDAVSGIAVTATPQSTIAYQTGYPYLTNNANTGLGVVSVKSVLLPNDPLINVGESIKFSFSPTIEVRSISFTEMQNFWGFGDYVALSYFDGTTTQKLKSVHAQGTGTYDTYIYMLPDPVTAVTFTIGSDYHLLNSFGIGGITVDYAGSSIPSNGTINSVGIPPSIWAGITVLCGLIGGRFWSRRRLGIAVDA